MVAVEGQGRCAFATQDLPAREMLLEEGAACLGFTGLEVNKLQISTE